MFVSWRRGLKRPATESDKSEVAGLLVGSPQFGKKAPLPRFRCLIIFRAKKTISSGVIEGLNNKVKVTFRTSYGFRTDKAREIALFHVLGKLPEPEVIHGFI
jgi:hypothetical protein